MDAIFLSLLLGSPWLVAVAATWTQARRLDNVPLSLGYQSLERLRAA